MTIVEKAAYLKGLTEGLGIEPESKEGRLWSALNDLLHDMTHEIEDLQADGLDFAGALDDISEELDYLESLSCDLDEPEDEYGEYEDADDAVESSEEDEELMYDGVVYDLTCPVCREEITIDEETFREGSMNCPRCGEHLEFIIDEDDAEDGETK